MTNPTAPADADLIARLRNDHNNQTSVDAANRLAEMQQKTDGLNQTLAGTYVRAEKAERAITELRQALAEREATIAAALAKNSEIDVYQYEHGSASTGDVTRILSAAPGDALSARLAEVEWQRDRAEAELKGAYHGAKTLRGWLDRAEQCIEQVREARLMGATYNMYRGTRDALAAYDAARETPAPALHDNETETER